MNPRNPLVIGAMVAAGLRSGMFAEMEPVPMHPVRGPGMRRIVERVVNSARPDLTHFTHADELRGRRRLRQCHPSAMRRRATDSRRGALALAGPRDLAVASVAG
jgi:hypothetical protein